MISWFNFKDFFNVAKIFIPLLLIGIITYNNLWIRLFNNLIEDMTLIMLLFGGCFILVIAFVLIVKKK
jgi:hypothetical protein